MKTFTLLAALALLTTAASAATVTLEWDPSPAEDLSHYTIYRAESDTRTTPALATFDALGTTTLTTLLDVDVPASNLFYTATASDQSGNESEKCKPIMVDVKAPAMIEGLSGTVTINVKFGE